MLDKPAVTRASLPNTLRHRTCDCLIRLGSAHDGGYLVAEADLLRTDHLLSFGIGENWEFEQDFCQRNTVPVTAYDASVGPLDHCWRALDLVTRSLSLRRATKSVRKCWDYRSFFQSHPHNRHISRHVGIGHQYLPMEAVLGETDAGSIFVKMDIEGSEYRCLEALIEDHGRISGAVIEFHDVDLHMALVDDFVRRFGLELVHIHANNFAPLSDSGLPHVLELTFSRHCEPQDRECVYPHPLDRPNSPAASEIIISFAER
ncbi:hypothetical protein [Oricola sp.]|uniref:hypothetical protein n=1 Tax=Oricola sp. TaxID=1979950 RepID=UPI003BA90E60